jgi:hypothetical protein
MGVWDSFKARFLGAARIDHHSYDSSQHPAAMREQAELAGLRRLGVKFQTLAADVDQTIEERARVLALGDLAAIGATIVRTTRSIDRMEEYLDLAGGELVDLLSLQLERQTAFGAVVSYGAGLASYKEAATAALAGDLATAEQRMARGAELFDECSDVLRGPHW